MKIASEAVQSVDKALHLAQSPSALAARHDPCNTAGMLFFRIVVLGAGHLRRVLTAYVEYSNHARPHQGLEQHCLIRLESAARDGPIEMRDILGGVLHDYHRRAA